MLNLFKVSGFKVFGRPVEVSLVPKTKNYQNLEENLIINNQRKNLKSVLLYGGNNAGKSSFVEALMVFKMISIKGGVEDFPFDLFKNFCYKEKDILFEVSFFDGQDDITYGIEFNESKEIGEYIFVNEKLMFSRERDGFIEGEIIEKYIDIKTRIDDLPINKLVLTYMNQYVKQNSKTDIFFKIEKFFGKLVFLNDASKNLIMSKEILEFVSNENKMNILNKLINSAEMFLEKRELASENYVLQNEYYNKYISKVDIDRMKTDKQLDGLRMVSYYKNKEGQNVARPSIFFDSIGTNKFIVISMFVINALMDNKILLIDEIDNSLHYKLTRALTILMNSSLNTGSQFIMTTHDVKLLSPKLFRKDQINFAIRTDESVSIVCLDDFKANSSKDIRSDSNFEKMYVEERIVDLPDTNISNFIEEIQKLWKTKKSI